MASVVIPAHNEETVLGRCLEAILAQTTAADEIIVVCNGCTDRTEEVAARYAPRVTVLATSVPSKANALNLGDAEATRYPRLYVDADVLLKPGCIQSITDAFATTGKLALAPTVQMTRSPSKVVNAYYDIWLSLPYCRRGLIGAGTYAVCAQGRARFDKFPLIIADDGFFRAQFSEAERGRVPGAISEVQSPRDLESLIKIKTRSRLGRYELHARFPNLSSNEEKDYRAALVELIMRPSKWFKVLLYVYVNIRTRRTAAKWTGNVSAYEWEVDQSSRAS